MVVGCLLLGHAGAAGQGDVAASAKRPRHDRGVTVCRWLGDRIGMFRITVAGLFLMAVGYTLLGPAPPLQALLGPMHQEWLIWVSLSIVGVGAGMAFVPLLPAMLTSLAAVSIPAQGSCLPASDPAQLTHFASMDCHCLSMEASANLVSMQLPA